MKRILILLAAVSMLVLGAMAQTRFLVTLSHEGQLTFFDNVSSFEDAIEASVDGDIIYLSEGRFGREGSSIKIENKRISIVGVGYKSHIIPDIRINIHTDSLSAFTAPLFDGVRLEMLSFAGYILNDIEIKKSYISRIHLSSTKNVILDRCTIDSYNNDTGKDILISNSKIVNLSAGHEENVENCNIGNIYSHPNYAYNCIIGDASTLTGGLFENCMLGNLAGLDDSLIMNCYDCSSLGTGILDENLECTVEDMSQYLGIDGTVVGIYGGQWFPFSETPSVPTVDSANSSVTYDADNNKLNVTITVAPN